MPARCLNAFARREAGIQRHGMCRRLYVFPLIRLRAVAHIQERGDPRESRNNLFQELDAFLP